MVNYIHFIDGEKGGVGKSLFARVMVQRCKDRNYPYVLVESDASNPDVGEVYYDELREENGTNKPVYTQVTFSDSERKTYDADQIFELSLLFPVIVNLPAAISQLTTEWIDRNELTKLKDKVRICKWFISNGGYDSIQLFIQSLNHFEDGIQHVFVRNLGLCPTWSHVEKRKELQDLIKQYEVAAIDFPLFPYPERDYMDEKRCTFDAARSDEGLGGILPQQRLATFLRLSYEQIDKVEGIVWEPGKQFNNGERNVESDAESKAESNSKSNSESKGFSNGSSNIESNSESNVEINGSNKDSKKRRTKKPKEQSVASGGNGGASESDDVVELENQAPDQQPEFVEGVS